MLCLVCASVLFFFHAFFLILFLAYGLSASNKKICGTLNWTLVPHTRSLIHTWQKKSWLSQTKARTFDYDTIISLLVDLVRVQLPHLYLQMFFYNFYFLTFTFFLLFFHFTYSGWDWKLFFNSQFWSLKAIASGEIVGQRPYGHRWDQLNSFNTFC